ncbi:Ig-like domain-containing protein [Schnuerera sp. xch1]|uniref:Ig-like domain-containing protein n=1 Tax=Schnuerera sp. xch1 TaxID=2874283 RepID=UPI001CBAB1E9|nr:Ig-like domain-containing protein [Schnuerera sp. xch1]MBZ2175124.1 Ig-like domain-containing protein [Schnuerera sp. xch1]
MKRKLSLLLAVVMILGSFSFVLAEEAEEEPAIEEVAGEFLMDEGVIEGINGELKLDDNFRRQDMVVMISRLMGAEDEAEEFPTDELTFTDFSDPYYRPIIAWAVANELIEGHTDERFGFNEDVTAQDYATVLLRALGYGEDVADDEGYDGALELAKELGLLGDYEFDNDSIITRGQMFVLTVNTLGTTMKDSEETLAENLGVEMPEPDELKVEKVYADNLKEVEVALSSADLASGNLENEANYRIPGNSVENAELVDDVIRLTVKDKLDDGEKEELIIRGLDKELNGRYDFYVKDNTAPYVVEVEALGEYGIKVITNEPIEEAHARDFLLDGKKVTMEVEKYGRDIILTPYGNRTFDLGEAVLTVGSLEDYAGFKSSSEDFDIDIVEDDEAPVVLGAEASEKVVTVEFDKDVYIESLDEDNALYEVGRSEVEATGYKKVDSNKVEYKFNRDFSRRDTLVIRDVENHSGVAMPATEVDVVEVDDDLEPEVIDYDIYYDDEVEGDYDYNAKVVLTFDEYIDEDSEGEYTLWLEEVDEDKVDQDVKFDINKDKVTIYLTDLKVDEDYVLEVEDFEDEDGNEMYVYYVDFTTPGSVGDFKVLDVSHDDEEIEIKLNESVDLDVAEELSNYIFTLAYGGTKNLRDIEGEVYVENDGKTIVLEVPDLEDKVENGEYKTLIISSILRDEDGNKLAKDVVYDFDEGKTNVEEEAEKVVSDAKDKVENSTTDGALEVKISEEDVDKEDAVKTAVEDKVKDIVDDSSVVVKVSDVEPVEGEDDKYTATVTLTHKDYKNVTEEINLTVKVVVESEDK